ncbi:Uncharacterised protein [uncultured archaeon]|nr:Uncharacterised protein [uncultured archaeon]
MKTYDHIILHLLKNPGQKMSINQIAERIERAPSGVFRELKKMETDNIVQKEKAGNSIIYRLNTGNLETKRLAEIALIKEKKERLKQNPYLSVISKDMESLGKYADILILFGSAARAKEYRDIDIFVVTKERFIKEIEAVAKRLSRLYDKSVSPLILAYPDFTKNIMMQDKVVLEVIRSGVVLKGYDKFVEAVMHGEV